MLARRSRSKNSFFNAFWKASLSMVHSPLPISFVISIESALIAVYDHRINSEVKWRQWWIDVFNNVPSSESSDECSKFIFDWNCQMMRHIRQVVIIAAQQPLEIAVLLIYLVIFKYVYMFELFHQVHTVCTKLGRGWNLALSYDGRDQCICQTTVRSWPVALHLPIFQRKTCRSCEPKRRGSVE